MEDNIFLGANFGQILSEQVKVIEGFGSIENAVLKAAKTGEKFTLGEEGLPVLAETTAKLNLINKLGSQLNLTFSKVENQWVLINKEIALAKNAINGVIPKSGLGIAARAITKNTKLPTDTNISTLDALNYTKPIEALKEFVKQNDVSEKKVNQIWRDLANGEVKNYDRVLNEVRDKIARIQQLKAKLLETDSGIKQEAFSRNAKAQSLLTGREGSRQVNNLTAIPSNLNLSNKEQLSYQKAITNLKDLVTQNGVSADKINKIWADVANGNIKNYGTSLNKVRDAVVDIQNKQANFASKTSDQFKLAEKILGRYNTELTKSTQIWKTLIRLQLSNVATRGISTFFNSIRDGVQDAKALSIAVGQISTVDISDSPLSKISKELIQLSNLTGLPVLDVAKAQYQALSNQVVSGAESFEFMRQANEFAISTLATSEEAVNLLSSAINAYGLSTADTEIIASSFFKTLELGRLKVSDIANTFGRTAVLADEIGVSLFETQATMALFTRQGIKADQANTLLRNVLLKLIKPTKEMTLFLNELGFSSAQAAIEALGFAGVMSKIEERAASASSSIGELGELFSQVRSITGASIFQGTGIKEFERDLKLISESTGTVNKQFKKIEATSGQVVEKGLNKVRNSLIDVGNRFIETIANLEKSFQVFEKLSLIVKFTSDNLGTLASIAGGLVLAKIYLLIRANVANTAATIAYNKALEAQNAILLANSLQSRANAVIKAEAAAAELTAANKTLVSTSLLGQVGGIIKNGALLLFNFAKGFTLLGALAGTAISALIYSLYKLKEIQKENILDNEKFAESFAKIEAKKIADLADNYRLLNAEREKALKNTVVQENEEISKKIQSLSENRKTILESVNLLKEAQDELSQKAIDEVDSRINNTKERIREIESLVKKTKDNIKDQQKLIDEDILGTKLANTPSSTKKRLIIDTEIAKVKNQGVQKDAEQEQLRLERIVELYKQRKELATTKAKRELDTFALVEARKNLIKFNEERGKTLVKEGKAKELELKGLEQDKARLKDSEALLKNTIKQVEALATQSDKYSELITKEKELGERLKARLALLQKLGISSDVETVSISKGGNLTSEQVNKINEILKGKDVSSGLVSFSSELGVNAKDADTEKRRLEANKIIQDTVLKSVALGNTINTQNKEISASNEKIKNAILTLGGEVGSILTKKPSVVSTDNLFERTPANQLKTERERAEVNTVLVEKSLDLLKKVSLAINKNDPKSLNRFISDTESITRLANLLEGAVNVKEGKLTETEKTAVLGVVTTLKDLVKISATSGTVIAKTKEKEQLDAKLKEDLIKLGVPISAQTESNDIANKRLEAEIINAPLIKAVDNLKQSMERLGTIIIEDGKRTVPVGTKVEGGTNSPSDSGIDGESSSLNIIPRSLEAIGTTKFLLTTLSNISTRLSKPVSAGNINVGTIQVNVPPNNNLSKQDITNAVVEALPRLRRQGVIA